MPASINVRTLASSIRGSSQVNPVVVSDALLQLQAGMELLERRLVSLSQPYGSTLHNPDAVRIHGSTLLPGTVTVEFNGTINASQITGLIQANQIFQVNANQITGLLTAEQIESIGADQIVGMLTAGQIESIAATQITGVIQSDQIESLVVEKLEGVIVSSQLADGIIDSLAKFAPTIRPVPIVNALPALPDANYPNDSMVILSTDHKPYRNAGGNWISTTAAGDITGQLTDSQLQGISANKITGLIVAAQIQSIAATQITGTIQSNQIASIAATQITGTITSGQIASITAGQITGTISSSQIGNLQITADHIANLTITGGKIANAAITNIHISDLAAEKINTGTLTVGGTYGVNPQIIVNDATATQIAFIGVDSSGNRGAWFKTVAVGGTNYASAPLKSDATGALTISNANLTITNSDSTARVTMGPTLAGGIGFICIEPSTNKRVIIQPHGIMALRTSNLSIVDINTVGTLTAEAGPAPNQSEIALTWDSGAGWGTVTIGLAATGKFWVRRPAVGTTRSIYVDPTTGYVRLETVGAYANNAAAVGAGLPVGTVYRTGGDPDLLCVVH